MHEFLGDNPIFIFPANQIGGHEIMAIKIINDLLPFVKCIKLYVTPNSLKRIEPLILDNEKIIISTLYSNTIKFEYIHNFINFYYKLKIKNQIENLIKNKYSSFILVQGDIEIGSSYLIELLNKNVKVFSYIPYAHDSKTVGKKFYIFREIYAKYLFSKNINFITISNFFKNQILSRNNKSNVYVIENSVRNLEKIKLKRKNIFSTSKNKFKLYVIGRVDYKHKGQDILLDALNKLDSKILNHISLNIIGEGPDSENLRTRVEKDLNEIDLNMLGWKAEPWNYAFEADLIVIPSRFEGVPLVMLEALELKIDVIGTRRDGMLDYLEEKNLFKNCEDLSLLIYKKLENFKKLDRTTDL
ncbi:glycosyltransferase [Acinetobacter soli]|uniref:glycosyltransferase n=1 Tax=Acinetobacter soli TaxID=487316 RepID=UPI00300C145E